MAEIPWDGTGPPPAGARVQYFGRVGTCEGPHPDYGAMRVRFDGDTQTTLVNPKALVPAPVAEA